jgi:hypothetical protein
MSESHLVSIAKRVVEVINSNDAQDQFVLKFTAVRAYIARRARDEMKPGVAYVDVLHSSEITDLRDRSNTAEIDFGIQVAVRGVTLTEAGVDDVLVIDRYMLLTEQISDYLRCNHLMDGVSLKSIDHSTIFDTEQLKDRAVFVAAPIFVYRAQRTQT